jgi:hypothetical protein
VNLGELINELREGILHDFSDQVAGSVDYLWTDQRLTRYIDEAQRRFSRESLCIRDGKTPDVCYVELQNHQKEYPLHYAILGVVSARVTGDSVDLARAGHANFQTYYRPDNFFFDTSYFSALTPGKVLAYDTDEFVLPDSRGTMARMNLKVYPEPVTPYLGCLHLRVVRLPLTRLTLGTYRQISDMTPQDAETILGVIPEVPEEHHMDMLDWAAHLALRIVDHDAGDPDRAEEFRQSFETKTKEARNVAMRKMFAPSMWGFGRNGFSWESQWY